MNFDPETCVVSYKDHGPDGHIAESMHTVATRDMDGIQQAWAKVVAENDLQSSMVQAIFSEWSATDEDVEFLMTRFPDACKLQFDFPGKSTVAQSIVVQPLAAQG